MKNALVKERAKMMGINARNKSKEELIREIQIKEGYSPCYKTDLQQCCQNLCAWRKECLPNN